jgi:hypothetical protein
MDFTGSLLHCTYMGTISNNAISQTDTEFFDYTNPKFTSDLLRTDVLTTVGGIPQQHGYLVPNTS